MDGKIVVANVGTWDGAEPGDVWVDPDGQVGSVIKNRDGVKDFSEWSNQHSILTLHLHRIATALEAIERKLSS